MSETIKIPRQEKKGNSLQQRQRKLMQDALDNPTRFRLHLQSEPTETKEKALYQRAKNHIEMIEGEEKPKIRAKMVVYVEENTPTIQQFMEIFTYRQDESVVKQHLAILIRSKVFRIVTT